MPEYPQDFHKIDQLGTSALHSKADIGVELMKRSANDPKRTLITLEYYPAPDYIM